jgi:hypothetical protein
MQEESSTGRDCYINKSILRQTGDLYDLELIPVRVIYICNQNLVPA